MRQSELKMKLINILHQEMHVGIGFLDKRDITILIQRAEQNKLTEIDRRNIAAHVLANYFNENTDEIEELIDWIMKK